jgi:hypothetical protein
VWGRWRNRARWRKRRPRQYLTEEELGKLMAHRFNSDSLSFARDIFVFSAFTGLSFIDIRELRLSDIMDIKGAAWTYKYHNDSDLCKNHDRQDLFWHDEFWRSIEPFVNKSQPKSKQRRLINNDALTFWDVTQIQIYVTFFKIVTFRKVFVTNEKVPTNYLHYLCTRKCEVDQNTNKIIAQLII